MTIRGDADALLWAQRETNYIAHLKTLIEKEGEKPYYRGQIEEARKKRNYALVWIWNARGNASDVPVRESDEVVAAWLADQFVIHADAIAEEERLRENERAERAAMRKKINEQERAMRRGRRA